MTLRLLIATFAISFTAATLPASANNDEQLKLCATDTRNPKQLSDDEVEKCRTLMLDHAIKNDLVSQFEIQKPQVFNISSGEVWGSEPTCEGKGVDRDGFIACPTYQCANVLIYKGRHWSGQIAEFAHRSTTPKGKDLTGRYYTYITKDRKLHIDHICPIKGATDDAILGYINQIKAAGQYQCRPYGGTICSYPHTSTWYDPTKAHRIRIDLIELRTLTKAFLQIN